MTAASGQEQGPLLAGPGPAREAPRGSARTPDLTTRYLGLELRSPLVAAASPLTGSLEGLHRLAEAGIGAVVLPSLFEEEIVVELERQATLAAAGSERFAESLTYLPPLRDGEPSVRSYLALLERAASSLPVPVLASLNAATPGGWTRYAAAMQDGGAAAIEVNVWVPPADAGPSARELEDRHVEVLELVKAAVDIPVAVKLGPYLSSIAEVVHRLDDAGADGVVLFNRFLHPDIDPETFAVEPALGLSSPEEGRLARTWIALLRRSVRASLAASTGVEGCDDVARFLLAGADAVTSASALLRHGPSYAAALLDGLRAWMGRKGFSDLRQLRGLLAVPPSADEAASERAGYVRALREANMRLHGPW
jgi:dihydroorotate dehydrogenase (fumarate)